MIGTCGTAPTRAVVAIVAGLILTILFGGLGVYGQGEACKEENLPTDKNELKKVLEACEKEIEKERIRLGNVQRERTNTERDISVINHDITSGELEVRSLNVEIQKLDGQIRGHKEEIESLNENIEKHKGLVTHLLQSTNEADSRSFAHIFFSDGSLSDFLSDVQVYSAVQVSTQKTIEDIDRMKGRANRFVAELNDSQEDQEKVRLFRKTQVGKNKGMRKEKTVYLQQQQQQERLIEEDIKTREQLVAEIRSRLFELRGSKAIPFGEALEYAQFAKKITGVRASFLLGLIQQESALGKNVGSGNWIADMHPTRDRPVFEAMARDLGFDPEKTPVSKRLSYGWGGAMGPAQFIPSTWTCFGGMVNKKTGSCQNKKGLPIKEFYAGPWEYNKQYDRIRSIVGKSSPSDPWLPRDAFVGAALLLRDNGALKDEYCAALKYYSGNCSASNRTRFGFYPRSVLALSNKIQKDIDFLSGR